MPIYTFDASGAVAFVDWNTPSDWLPETVPNSSDADVVLPLITYEGEPYDYYVTVESNESYTVHSLTIDHQTFILDGSLSIGSDLTIGAGGEVDIAGSLSIGGLSNSAGIDIQGSGQISSAVSIDNAGEIIGNGLTLAVAALRNDGTLLAAGGILDVDVASDPGAFANLSDGTLSLGTYEALGGSVLLLNVGSDITTDAADIVLNAEYTTDNPAPVIETSTGAGGTADLLTHTLQMIASAGVLTLQSTGFAGTVPLTVAGIVQLDSGTMDTPGLTIMPGGIVAGGGTIDGPVTNDGTLVATTGVPLVLEGVLDGNGEITLQTPASSLDGGIAINTIELGGAASNHVSFEDWNGALVLDSPTQFSGAISGFAVGTNPALQGTGQKPYQNSDSIILSGVDVATITNVNYIGTDTAGTLILQQADGTIAFGFVGDYTVSDFVVASGPKAFSTSPPSVVITEAVACFLTGTRIATDCGELPVELLKVGDQLQSGRGGDTAPIRWIGHRRVDCKRHPRPHDVMPVRVGAGAFATGVPRRDLLLSPDHAVFIDGVLIPIRYLINDATIVQERADKVTYWHVELARHDVILAEGLAAESYLDTGNRCAFANGGTAIRMHADFALRVWACEACAPLVRDGAELAAARSYLLERAELLGHAFTHDPAIRVIVGGREQRPEVVQSLLRFSLPAGELEIVLASRSAIPAHVRDDSSDHRRLGVAVSNIVLDGETLALNDSRLGSGWHDLEHDGAGMQWRWTDGKAMLASGAGRVLVICVAMTERYWREAPVRRRTQTTI